MFQGALRVKHKKMHRYALIKTKSRLESKLFVSKFGDFSLKATESGFMTPKQIETGRRYIRKMLAKGGKIKINVFPYLSQTKKPVSARMGKGKGRISGWVSPVKKGRIIFEISLSKYTSYKKQFRLTKLQALSKKMPVKLNFVKLMY